MYMSQLARSVFEQTDAEESPELVLWVEQTLQNYKINGVIKLIQGSKKIEPDYLSGYFPKFKWAKRSMDQNVVFDETVQQVYKLICNFITADFEWYFWKEIFLIRDIILFESTIDHVSNLKDKNNLSYLFAVYNRNVSKNSNTTVIQLNEYKPQQPVTDIITNDTKNNWQQLKKQLI